MKRLFSILITVLLLIPSIGLADSDWGFKIPRQKDGLQLMGSGVLRKGFFFKIYVGALYLQRPGNGVTDLHKLSKRIDIHYFHNTPKKHMINAAHTTLKQNLSAEEYSRLLPDVDKLHAAFLDGRNGAVASILHKPGEGLYYFFNDELQLFVSGDDFANAYFSIWLGESPSSRSMKTAMLEGWNP